MSDTKTTIKSGFWDSVNHDRVYSADDMNEPYKSILTEGIIETGFAVTAQSTPDMTVNVAAGRALLAGKWVDSAPQVMTVPANATLYSRIDSVILQIDANVSARKASLVYRTGTAAATPQAPALVNTGGITELRIANITVAAGASSIASGNIADTRGTSACPYMTLNVADAQIESVLMDIITAHPELITAVPDGGITTAKLANGAVTLQKLASSVIDSTLTQAGNAADAKATGDAITDLNNDLSHLSQIMVYFDSEGYLCFQSLAE